MLKKVVFGLLLMAMCPFLIACSGSSGTADSSVSVEEVVKVDVDLSKMSDTVAYAKVNDMFEHPDNYIGKTVRANGSFGLYTSEVGQNYYACLLVDDTGCCTAGIEFVLDEDCSYPEDYPDIDSNFTVSGDFSTYEEDGMLFITLLNATIE